MTGAPGTAELSEDLLRIKAILDQATERKRAMMLSWVDEFERCLGYGCDGRPPRTAEIRQYWRDRGEPKL